MRTHILVLKMVMVMVLSQSGLVAADPLKGLLGDKQSNLPRLPNDQIEGTIWEYKGTLRDKLKEGEVAPTLEGRFRTEGKAIFDISRRIGLPDKKDVEKTVEKVKEGKLKELKLPAAPQQKRLGQYRKLDATKLRLDFDDKESLNGVMVIWPKKNTADVWLGTFVEKQGTKTSRNWNVELRPIED